LQRRPCLMEKKGGRKRNDYTASLEISIKENRNCRKMRHQNAFQKPIDKEGLII